MTKFKFGDKVNCIHGIGIVSITYFDYEFDEFICEVVFILDNKTCTYKSLESELTKVSDWIPCSERMPDIDVEVLVYFDGYIYIDSLYYDKNLKEYWWQGNCRLPTHWMQLPDMPEVKE